MQNFIAQTPKNVGGPFVGIGEYGSYLDWENKFTRILTTVVGILTIIAGIWFIFLLLTGGIEWISSGGDKGKLASARSRMFSGAVGLAIVVAALFIAQILGGYLGFPNILDPVNEIQKLP